jgi:hypothetical protein
LTPGEFSVVGAGWAADKFSNTGSKEGKGRVLLQGTELDTHSRGRVDEAACCLNSQSFLAIGADDVVLRR